MQQIAYYVIFFIYYFDLNFGAHLAKSLGLWREIVYVRYKSHQSKLMVS